MNEIDVIESWLVNVGARHSKSSYTRRNYRSALRTFTNFVGETAEQIIEENERIRSYIAEKKFNQKYVRYLNALVAKLDEQGLAPNSVNNVVVAVKSFFKYNGMKRVLEDVEIGKTKVIFHNRDITKEEIVRILAISRPRDKAFFCVMTQSGLRPVTMAQLKYEHIREDFEAETIPMKISVPSEIAKGEFGSYFTFVGEESVKYLKAYLNKRPNIQPEDYLFTSHGTDKKLSPRSLSKIFNHAIKKLEEKGVINNVKRKQMGFSDKSIVKLMANVRLYNLRKFFRKYAQQAGIEYVNFWMGHKTNYKAPHISSSDDYYFSKTDEEFHRKQYEKFAMPHLRLETPIPTETDVLLKDIRELRKQLMEKDTYIQKQEGRLRSLEKFQKDTLAKISEYAAFARELKSLLPEDRRKEIIEKLKKQEANAERS